MTLRVSKGLFIWDVSVRIAGNGSLYQAGSRSANTLFHPSWNFRRICGRQVGPCRLAFSYIPSPFSKDIYIYIYIYEIITKSEKWYKPSCRPANGESVRLTGLAHPYKQALNNLKTFFKKTLSNKSPKSRGSKALPVVDTSWQFPKYFLSSQLNGLSRKYLLSEAQREEFR